MSGWQNILKAAEVEDARFRSAMDNVETCQRLLLLETIKANVESQFGIDHQFSKIRSITDFQSAVPISNYDGFRDRISAIANGKAGVLTRSPVIAFEETGGTSGGAKLIPYTSGSLAAFRSAILPSLFDLARRRPGITKGQIYAAMSPATREAKHTASGFAIGLPNDAAYLGEDLLEAFASLLAVPPEIGAIVDVKDWKRATLKHLRNCHSLSFVSVWSPTFWLELFDAQDPADWWPGLDTISCWMDGSSAFFAKELQRKFPKVHLEPKGLLSTESAITLSYGEEEGCVPAVTSAFLEFQSDSGDIFLLHQLEAGRVYRVIVTTPGGLYRYDTEDLLQCVSIRNDVPRFKFLGRAGNVSDMVGEKLDEAFVAAALARLPVASRLVARKSPKPHYEIWLRQEVDAIEPSLEAALGMNPQYAYARKMGQLGPLVSKVVPDLHMVFDSGKRLAVAKPTLLSGLQSVEG